MLPIRVAGWQPTESGSELVYARSDQLIAGLERAVDPNGDGDEHDAVRVALVGVAEPYAAFADGPEAQAVQGALDLNTLVVAPAGNDGGAGPAFGSVAGPGRCSGCACGRCDRRAGRSSRACASSFAAGLDVILDERLPLLGAAAPSQSRTLPVAVPRTAGSVSASSTHAVTVSSRAAPWSCRRATTPRGQSPPPPRAGASAVLLYGANPAGRARCA